MKKYLFILLLLILSLSFVNSSYAYTKIGMSQYYFNQFRESNNDFRVSEDFQIDNTDAEENILFNGVGLAGIMLDLNNLDDPLETGSELVLLSEGDAVDVENAVYFTFSAYVRKPNGNVIYYESGPNTMVISGSFNVVQNSVGFAVLTYTIDAVLEDILYTVFEDDTLATEVKSGTKRRLKFSGKYSTTDDDVNP